jgi:hypothetical protein
MEGEGNIGMFPVRVASFLADQFKIREGFAYQVFQDSITNIVKEALKKAPEAGPSL